MIYVGKLINETTHPDDWINESAESILNEMSAPEPVVRQHLTRFDDTLFEHLMKLFYFRDPQYFNGWANSVYKSAIYVKKIKILKGKDKYPSYSQIYEWMWGEVEDCFHARHSGLLKDFNDKNNPNYKYLPRVRVNEANVLLFIRAYHDWLAKELSAKGQVTYRGVCAVLKRLLMKF